MRKINISYVMLDITYSNSDLVLNFDFDGNSIGNQLNLKELVINLFNEKFPHFENKDNIILTVNHSLSYTLIKECIITYLKDNPQINRIFVINSEKYFEDDLSAIDLLIKISGNIKFLDKRNLSIELALKEKYFDNMDI